MSAALQLLGNAADALAVHHDDAMVLRTATDQIAVSGYAEEVELDPAERGAKRNGLHISAELFSHIIHIRRDQLSAIELAKVSSIQHADSGRSYRVLHYTDDPMTSTTDFFCRLV